jgi:hypothetical protein
MQSERLLPAHTFDHFVPSLAQLLCQSAARMRIIFDHQHSHELASLPSPSTPVDSAADPENLSERDRAADGGKHRT